MRAAGLNPVDFKTREGKLRVIHRHAFPLVFGCELSGVVASVGERVTRLRPGDEVFTRVAKDRLGAFAEKACVDESLVAKKPTSLDFASAAAVPLAGLTALRALRDYDAAFDLVGGDTLERAFSVVRRGGKIVSIAGVPEPTTVTKDLHRGAGLALLFWLVSAKLRFRAWRADVAYRYMFMRPSGTDLEQLANLVDAKQLEVVVDRTFPFAKIAEAVACLERGHAKGKVVVTME